jgi:hypothetical protein
MKSFTDIEQSKVLCKILPIKSADMYWDYDVQKHEDYPMIMDDQFDNLCIPAWSLAALFEVLPKYIEGSNRLRIDINNVDFSIWYDDLRGYGVNNELPNIVSKEPVDACVSMIEKLHELNLL